VCDINHLSFIPIILHNHVQPPCVAFVSLSKSQWCWSFKCAVSEEFADEQHTWKLFCSCWLCENSNAAMPFALNGGQRARLYVEQSRRACHLQVMVFGLVSAIVERLGDLVHPHAPMILSWLPQVWQNSEGQGLLRMQVCNRVAWAVPTECAACALSLPLSPSSHSTHSARSRQVRSAIIRTRAGQLRKHACAACARLQVCSASAAGPHFLSMGQALTCKSNRGGALCMLALPERSWDMRCICWLQKQSKQPDARKAASVGSNPSVQSMNDHAHTLLAPCPIRQRLACMHASRTTWKQLLNLPLCRFWRFCSG
jgi:hypothetical protein